MSEDSEVCQNAQLSIKKLPLKCVYVCVAVRMLMKLSQTPKAMASNSCDNACGQQKTRAVNIKAREKNTFHKVE